MRWMKYIVKECFRYRISGIALVSCFVISMLAMHYGIAIYSNLVEEQNEVDDYRYISQQVMYSLVKNETDVPSLPKNTKAQLRINNVFAHFKGEPEDYTRMIDVIVYPYQTKWPLVSGEYPSEELLASREKIALIGQGLSEETYEQNGNAYILISGDEYRVIGVFGSDKSATFDETVVLYWDCLGENIKKSILSNYEQVKFILESDYADTLEIYKAYIMNQHKMDLQTSIYGGDIFYSAVPVQNERIYCISIYLFIFSCIWIVLKYWMTQRGHEMNMCRAFGFTDGKIVLRLIRSIACVLTVSVTITFILTLLIQLCFQDVIKQYRLYYSPKYMLLFAVIYMITLLFVGGGALYRFVRCHVADEL